MRPFSRLLLTFCALALGAGCGGDATTSPTGERARLEASREKWARKGYRDYTVTVSRSCFCQPIGPILLIVDADTVRSAIQISNGQPLDRHLIPSVTQLFDFIAQGLDHGANVLEVTYDDVLGYPHSVTFDGSAAVADDEITYTLTDLLPIERK